MATNVKSLEQRIVHYDCLSGIALALVMRHEKMLTDEEFALLRQAFQEIALLAKNTKFDIDSKGITHSVDSYLSSKLHKLGDRFNAERPNEARLKFDVCLLMREQLLEIIELLTKIAFALKGIQTAAAIEAYDVTLVQACLNEIKQLKDLYTLINCFPIESVIPKELKKCSKDFTKLLAIHHKPHKSKTEEYRIEKMQSFLLHQLVQISSTTRSLMGDLQALSSEPLPKIAEAEKIAAKTTDTLTDCLEKSLESNEAQQAGDYPKSLPPTLKGIATVLDPLETFLTSIQPLPRVPTKATIPYANLDSSLKSDKEWQRYRYHLNNSISQTLIG